MSVPLVVAYGGGVNSTAMLIGMFHRQIRPDLILFADTGGEKPETYDFIEKFNEWLGKVLFPLIVTVRNDGMHGTLEKECLTNHQLPSLAYGWKKCSDKYKRRPQDKYVKTWWPARRCWDYGLKVKKAIGYDAGERRRAKIFEDDLYTYWHPLLDWNWWREECLDAITAEGLPIPPKSACFFCPSSTKREVFRLAEEHPDLMERALVMEAGAFENLESIKGLGRRWSWTDLMKRGMSLPLFDRSMDEPGCEQACMCFDGDE